MFAQGMIPHHTQAIAMSSQASERAASQEVKDLAARIEQAQGPEIERMNQMLAAWGAPQPQPGSTHAWDARDADGRHAHAGDDG